MAFPTIATPSPSFMRSAGFNNVFIRTGAELWQTIGAINKGDLKIGNYKDNDSIGRNKSMNTVEFTAKCTMMQSSLTEIELLETMANGTCDFLFKCSDAAALGSSTPAPLEGWNLVTAAMIGCVKPKLDASGTPQENRKIDLEWQGSILLTEIDSVVKASLADSLFESSDETGTFHAIGTYLPLTVHNGGLPTPANIKACGFKTVTLADTGGLAQTLGSVKNAKLTMEFIADTDSLRRYQCHAIDINVEYEWMQTDVANLLNLDTMCDADIDLVITLLDLFKFTFTNQVGIDLQYENIGDYDKMKIIRFTHKGKVLKASLADVVSQG